MSTLYYLQSADKAYNASGIRAKTGLDPATTGVVMLNYTGVYPVNPTANPYDPRFYNATASYAINGTGADQSWSKTDKDLAEVKEIAKDIQKSKYEAQAQALQDDYGFLVLIAISAKTAASRSANETAVIDALKTIATDLSDDIIAIDAAADVDAVNTIVNS